MATTNQTIAFFGATGGCSGTILAAALRAGHKCTALARTPEKLRKFLINEHSIPESTIDSQLTIHSGNVKDPAAASQALISPTNSSVLVDHVVSGIGAAPVFQWTPPFVTIDDPNLCHTGIAAILAAVDLLVNKGITAAQDGRKPLITVISTTGISKKARDVPYLHFPFYHGLLRVPHIDKRKMEAFLFEDNGVHFRDFVVIRPTLLMDYKPYGLDSVRAGWEWGVGGAEKNGVKEPGPQMGYTIGRKDVGNWTFVKVIQEGGWEGKCISLC
ncbi:hypothetical protein K504DRAFT_433109 [Pleomassaria siparia CBS 279.74]|uniref:Uncharacterized protein n=1 Tax=Pleomassaria siparia CBS 279.74 TaxID=1314801 RepID=A0A6G1K720_9PLEO|nr:hypothetical protein K504DRAFT_433109 [Pleomassaria siparia CBS 279.74]